MGGGASVPIASAEDVAAQVRALGEPYHGYAERISADGIDGAFINSITSTDLPDLFTDVGVASAVHKKKLELVFASFKTNGDGGAPPVGTAMPAESKDEDAFLKAFAGFLSHFKHECGTEARLVQQNLKPILEREPVEGASNEVFLDSDDLSDLRNLLVHVRQSKALVLLQSKGVLTRPWVIAELYTAVTSDVPIVALNVRNSYAYDYAEALDFLMFFDQEIDIANPGAAQLLIDMGVDPEDVAYRLSDCLPNIISTDFNPNASEKVIQASLEDLVDSIRKASPIAPSVSKEEWLEKRKAYKPNSVKKAHGASEGVVVANTAAEAAPLADVPHTVPELPAAYIVRNEDLAQLKTALLDKGGSSSTALTSKKRQNKVGAHGMGGVGKTTIAAALVNDEDIRSSFEKIVWVSIGQEPDIRELQESLYEQIAGSVIPPDAKTPSLVFKALRDASKGCSMLLVLDDAWDAQTEKSLSCIDPDNSSKLLVTTRIRGLLKNSAEVELGVLPKEEALKLLLSSAEVDPEDVEEGSEEFRRVTEIVQLCGLLPLTLAIAGGMVADNGQGFTEDILDALKESNELEDEEGMTIETRVISTSEKMMVKGAGKHQELVAKVFHFFAIFPEDVAVPASFFNKMAPLLSDDKNEKKARLSVGACLATLLKYNLIKGSLSPGHGVYMHDIVRDYVIQKHSQEELRALQKAVADTVLSARPEPDGFPDTTFVAASTFEGYCVRYLHSHFRGALAEGEGPPDEWLTHVDLPIKAMAAAAVGLDALTALVASREEQGLLVRAAYASRAASLVKNITDAEHYDHLYKAVELLERAGDTSKEVLTYEKQLLRDSWKAEIGTERNLKAVERFKLLTKDDEKTVMGMFSEGMAMFGEMFVAMGFLGGDPSPDEMDEALRGMAKIIHLMNKAGNLPDKSAESFRNICRNLCGPMYYPFGQVTLTIPEWTPENFSITEESLIEGIEYYTHSVCGRAFKAATGVNMFQCGMPIPAGVLTFGSLEALEKCQSKLLAGWAEIDVITSRDYGNYMYEIFNLVGMTVGTHFVLGFYSEAETLMNSFGFVWSSDGFEAIDLMMATFKAGFTAANLEAQTTYFRLSTFLAAPEGAIDNADVNAWMPTPQRLAEMERNDNWLRRWALMNLCCDGAKAFLRLGRDDDAFQLALMGVSPEQKTEKKTTLSGCHSILGQVAAKRGDLDEADGHFKRAVEVGKQGIKMPMVELVAARDWKRFLLEPNGRDPSAADAAIDSACAAMNKTREQLASVLSKSS
jgi:hypothetical protein